MVLYLPKITYTHLMYMVLAYLRDFVLLPLMVLAYLRDFVLLHT